MTVEAQIAGMIGLESDLSASSAFGITRSYSRYVVRDRVLGGLAAWMMSTVDASERRLDEAFATVLRSLDVAEDSNAPLVPAPTRILLAALQNHATTDDVALQISARLSGQWVTPGWLDQSRSSSACDQSRIVEAGSLGDRDEPYDDAWSRLRGRTTEATWPISATLLGLEHGYFGLPAQWREIFEASPAFHQVRARLTDVLGEPSSQVTSVVRTSTSHPLAIGTLETGSNRGRIGVTFCPGKHQQFSMTGTWQRDLDLDLNAIVRWGATHLLTLVERWELSDLGVAHLPEAASMRGLQWHHFPIIDGTVPGAASEERWAALSAILLSALARGESVVIHCKGGLGRAGTMAARLLLSAGVSTDAEDAVARIRAVRPNAVETAVQERYLLQRADALRAV